MNKYLIGAVAICTAITLGACGSSKSSYTGETFDDTPELKLPSSQQKALEKPATRAAGVGTQFDLSFATSLAETDAQRAFARMLSSTLSAQIKVGNYGYNEYATDGQKGAAVADEEGKSTSFTELIINNLELSGLVIIDKNIFKKRDGRYMVYVCLEYRGDVHTLAANMAQGYRNAIEQQVPEADRNRIDENVKQLENDLYQRLREMNGEQ